MLLSACFPPFWSKKIWNVHQQRKLWQRCKMTKQATKSFFIAYFYIQNYCRLFTGMRDRKFQRVLKILLWYLGVNNFKWKGVVLTPFFCILFQPLIWIQDSKRKKERQKNYRWQNYKNTGRCSGSYNDTRSQNYKLSLQLSVEDDIKFVKNVIQR